jgi:hypothetical protein
MGRGKKGLLCVQIYLLGRQSCIEEENMSEEPQSEESSSALFIVPGRDKEQR